MYDLGLKNSKLPILGCSLKVCGVLKLLRENVVRTRIMRCVKKNVKNVNTKICKTVNDVQKKLLIGLCRY